MCSSISSVKIYTYKVLRRENHCEMDKTNLRLAIEYGLQRNGYTELRPNQEEIFKQVLNGRDILFCSPTGSGKSLIFEVAPFAFHFLGQMKSCCRFLFLYSKATKRNFQTKLNLFRSSHLEQLTRLFKEFRNC